LQAVAAQLDLLPDGNDTRRLDTAMHQSPLMNLRQRSDHRFGDLVRFRRRKRLLAQDVGEILVGMLHHSIDKEGPVQACISHFADSH
jgi:hypothetical protein